MEDPYDSDINPFCHYSSSQEEILKNSIIVREDYKSEPSPPSPPPSPASVAFDGNGIIICSAPDTQASETVASPSGDEYKTPPEESRRSSSEEPPPPNCPYSHGGESDSLDIDGENGTPACVASDAGTQDLGLSVEGNRTPKLVEVHSDEEVRVREVSVVDLDSFRVGEKRGLPVEDPSPSKKIRVSVDSSVMVNTSDLTPTEGKLEKVKVNRPIEIGVTVNMDMETEELDSGTEEAEQVTDTDIIEDCNDTEEECGTLNLQKEQEEKKEEEERMETIVDGAEDLSRQGKRNLPPSWAIQKGGKREDKKKPSGIEERESGGDVDIVMEMLRLLAEEESRKHRDDDGSIDFLETVIRCGLKFPEPKWWHEKD